MDIHGIAPLLEIFHMPTSVTVLVLLDAEIQRLRQTDWDEDEPDTHNNGLPCFPGRRLVVRFLAIALGAEMGGFNGM